MNIEQWKQYYTGILSRTFLRPEKKAEIIERCGGLKVRILSDNKSNMINRKETEDEAIVRLKAEVISIKAVMV